MTQAVPGAPTQRRAPLANTVVVEGPPGAEYLLVDGKPFPWHVSISGPVATQIGQPAEDADDLCVTDCLYFVTLTIISASDDEAFRQNWQGYPVIDGIEFPWAIVNEVTYRYRRDDMPTITLTFVALSVTGVPIDRVLPVLDNPKVKDINSYIVALHMPSISPGMSDIVADIQWRPELPALPDKEID